MTQKHPRAMRGCFNFLLSIRTFPLGQMQGESEEMVEGVVALRRGHPGGFNAAVGLTVKRRSSPKVWLRQTVWGASGKVLLLSFFVVFYRLHYSAIFLKVFDKQHMFAIDKHFINRAM